MRGKNTAAILAVAATMLLLAPMAQGQVPEKGLQNPNKSTPTSLYFHIFDVFNAFPINTQMPNPGFFKVGGTNFPTVVEPNSGTNYDFNTIYGYSTSGPVEYDFIENGQPRFHPERGIAEDVKIDAAAPATVYLYVSLRDVIGTETGPNYMPTYTYRFEMREKNQLGDEAELDSGKLIMRGEKTAHLVRTNTCLNPTTCVGADDQLRNQTDPNGVPYYIPNSDGIIEIAIPMTVEADAGIPKAEGYHVKLDWYQNPSGQADQNDRAAEGYMRLVSDAKYHPRLELSIMNPVYIEFIHPQVAAGILLIHSCLNSPWGTYDVDVANITVEIRDSAGKVVEADLEQIISQNAHVHDLHDKCAEVTYLWRFRGDPDNGVPAAPDGEYTIKIGVQNTAKTATATGVAGFVLEGKKAYGVDQGGAVVTNAPDPGAEVEESPGVGLLVIATLLGAAIVLRRRGA